jgi:hypothetical protein
MRYLLPLLLLLAALPARAADRYALPSADLEQIIVFFAREAANPRYYALDYSPDHPVSLITDTGEADAYIAFNLIPAAKGGQGVGPTYFLNMVSGQIFSLYATCTRHSLPRLDAFVAKRRAKHPVPADILAKHQAHFRAVSDPRSTTCGGEGLPP